MYVCQIKQIKNQKLKIVWKHNQIIKKNFVFYEILFCLTVGGNILFATQAGERNITMPQAANLTPGQYIALLKTLGKNYSQSFIKQ